VSIFRRTKGLGTTIVRAADLRPDSVPAEMFRTLRTNIQFSLVDKERAVVIVTSPLAEKGKTFVTSHLGVAFARAGKRVFVVDADFRHPSLHAYFGVRNDVGLAEVLLGEVRLGDAGPSVRAGAPASPRPPHAASLPARRRRRLGRPPGAARPAGVGRDHPLHGSVGVGDAEPGRRRGRAVELAVRVPGRGPLPAGPAVLVPGGRPRGSIGPGPPRAGAAYARGLRAVAARALERRPATVHLQGTRVPVLEARLAGRLEEAGVPLV